LLFFLLERNLFKKQNQMKSWYNQEIEVGCGPWIAALLQYSVVDKSVTKIDGNGIVSDLMENWIILANMSSLRNKCTQNVEKELSLNLLRDLLLLYIRARTFSYVKLKCDNFKLENKKRKMNSLRTSIKKASSSLDMGH